MAIRPTRPTAPAQALRSNPATFSANAEASIAYQWTVLPDWIEGMGDFVDARADEALAAALGGDLPPLTGKALNMIRVNAGETAVEFRTPAEVLSDLGVTATAAEINEGIVPAGAVQFFAVSTAPAGWLKANGALVSRATYAALFSAIGTTFGAGDGSTTFALPDLRGEFIRGWDDGRGVDSGRVLGAAQADALQQHDHNFQVTGGGSGNFRLVGATDGNGSVYDNSVDRVIEFTGPQGNFATETRPRNIALLACIKF